MKLNRKLASIASYLSELEQLYYDAGKNYKFTKEDQKTREFLHVTSQGVLQEMKITALESIVKEEEDK